LSANLFWSFAHFAVEGRRKRVLLIFKETQMRAMLFTTLFLSFLLGCQLTAAAGTALLAVLLLVALGFDSLAQTF
jgi:hypothetical protein